MINLMKNETVSCFGQMPSSKATNRRRRQAKPTLYEQMISFFSTSSVAFDSSVS